MGIYYMAPLLGPSLGPIFGGALTTGFNWRAIFWFLTVVSGSSFVAFVLLFKDTFRKERSSTYQNALRQRMEHAAKKGSSRPVSHRPSLEDVAQPKPSDKDVEKANAEVEAVAIQEPRPSIKVSLKDLSPIRPIGLVLRRKNNTVVLFASGSSLPLQLCNR
jgi:MFS family permease